METPLCASHQPSSRYLKRFFILFVAAVLLFSANMEGFPLRSLDDCFYARKGIEMYRNGSFFTVTWNQKPTFQNPPLHFWILGSSFRILGETDSAARLPTVLMGALLLIIIFRIGWLVVGPAGTLTGISLLLITPYFLVNARRVMLEIPATFWACLTVLLFLEGLRKPHLHLLLGIPLAACIWTKSVLGLLPLMIIVSFILLYPPAAASVKKPWIWTGAVAGILLGAFWTIHQYAVFGSAYLQGHYFSEIYTRSTTKFDLINLVFGYPMILLERFQPVIFPAIAGIYKSLKDWKAEQNIRILMPLWILLPLVLYSFSAARTVRYIFPIFPALALVGGFWLSHRFSQFSRLLYSYFVPLFLIAGGIALWLGFTLGLENNSNEIFRTKSKALKALIRAEEKIPYLGDEYWPVANPLLYYAERALLTPSPNARDAIRLARQNPSRILICDRNQLTEIKLIIKKRYQVVQELDRWLVLQLPFKRTKPQQKNKTSTL